MANLFLKKLKIILLCSILLIFRFTQLPQSKYTNEQTITATICKIHEKDELLQLEVQGLEKVLVQYYPREQERQIYQLGDVIEIKGELITPSSNRNFYLFNYQNYLKSKKIYWIMKAEHISVIQHSHAFWYTLKNKIRTRITKYKHSEYLSLFILGDSSFVETSQKTIYQKLGISHLFAISGMHVGLLTSFLLRLLQRKWTNPKIHFLLFCPILIFYAFLTDFSLSVMRAICFFLLLLIRKIANINMSKTTLLILLGVGMLLYHPYYIYHIGFLFSYIVTFALLYFEQHLSQFSYWKRILFTSTISFLVGVPLVIHNFSTINILSPIWNLFFIPYVSICLFPITILTFILPILTPILDVFIQLLEITSQFCFQVKVGFITFPWLPPWAVIILTLYIFYVIHCSFQKKRKPILLLILFSIFYYQIRIWDTNFHLTIIDVGQGDCILLELPHQRGTILVDTGGMITYANQKQEFSYAESVIIPYLNARGIHKLDYLILSHGDLDHAKEAIPLLMQFPISQVIMNQGNQTNLEQMILKTAKEEQVPVQQMSIGTIQLGNTTFELLNVGNPQNENEDSIVLYTKWRNQNILLMGDAGEEVEKTLLDKLPKIDFLKVGHHGSRYSSSASFIKFIHPKYALISVGANNRFDHPHLNTIETLQQQDSKIYRTDEVGMIHITIGNEVHIKTRFPSVR